VGRGFLKWMFVDNLLSEAELVAEIQVVFAWDQETWIVLAHMTINGSTNSEESAG
jgi:hypothetical protein